MAKKSTQKADNAEDGSVAVRLLCFYSGHPAAPCPGDVVKVDAEEAERLISLGAAVAV